MQKKIPDWKMFFTCQFLKRLWSSLAFTKVNEYSQTNTAAEDSQHLKVEIANCFSYVINRTCHYPV